MCKRIVIGGLAAGVAMFIWGALSHIVLMLGQSSIKEIPSEDGVLALMKANLTEPGLYFFPGMHCPPGASKEQKAQSEKQWNEKYLAGPRGILVYHPDGAQAMSPGQLLAQLGAEILTALLAAFVLSRATGLKTYVCRVTFVAMLGLFPLLIVSFPHWNWYGFPTAFTLFEAFDYVVAMAIAGLILAAIIKPAAVPAAQPAH